MTLIAQFDTEQDPPVVHTLYDYGDDDVPTQYKPPEYMDVTDENPCPQPGSTYDGDTWEHPLPPEDLAATAQEMVVANDAFLTEARSGDVPTLEPQVVALTEQVNKILTQRFGAAAP